MVNRGEDEGWMINDAQRFLVLEGQKDPKGSALRGIITGQNVCG